MNMEIQEQAGRKPLLWLALVAVILLGSGLRLYHLSAKSLWYDEGATLHLTRYVNCNLSLFNTTNSNEAPMNAVMVKAWYGLVRSLTDYPIISPMNDFLIRLLPALFGILTIPMIFLVARRILQDDWAGIIAAFLFSISPFMIFYAQELRIYSFYVLISLLALYGMVRAIEEDRWYWWWMMVLMLTLLMYSHFIAVWTIFSFNLYYVCVIWLYRRHFWKWFSANLILMALIAFPLYLAFEFDKIAASIVHKWAPNPTAKTIFVTFKNYFAGYGPSAWAYWPLFLMALFFFMLGLVALWRGWTVGRRNHGWTSALLLAIVVSVPLAGCTIIWTLRHFSFYEHRLFIFSGVAAMMAVSAGMRALGRPRWTAAALTLFTLFTLPNLADFYAWRLHPIELHHRAVWAKVDFRSAAAHIDNHWQEDDMIGHISHFTIYPMYHYLDKPQTRIGYAALDEQVFLDSMGNEPLLREHGLMPVIKEAATEHCQRVWLLESFGTTFEYKPLSEPIREWFDENWNLTDRQTFDGLWVLLYEKRESF